MKSTDGVKIGALCAFHKSGFMMPGRHSEVGTQKFQNYKFKLKLWKLQLETLPKKD